MGRNGWPVWVLLVGVATAGQARAQENAPAPPVPPPAVPIPIGPPGPADFAAIEWSPVGLTTRLDRRFENGDWAEGPVGRSGGVRRVIELFQTDYSRSSLTLHGRQPGAGVGVRHVVYLAESWLAFVEAEASTGGPRAAVRVEYYPFEGVAFGLGWDSRRGVVLHHRWSLD